MWRHAQQLPQWSLCTTAGCCSRNTGTARCSNSAVSKEACRCRGSNPHVGSTAAAAQRQVRIASSIGRHARLKENGGHRVQCLLRPGLKPVNDRVVHQAWEVAAARAQGLAHRRHGQNHMQVVTALQHKLSPAGLFAVASALLHSLHSIVVRVILRQQS